MNTPEMQKLGPYSEMQKQLQLLGRVFLGPIVSGRTNDAISKDIRATCTKLCPEYADDYDACTFWSCMFLDLFVPNVMDIVLNEYEACKNKNDTRACDYHRHLLDLVDVCLAKMDVYVQQHLTWRDIDEEIDKIRENDIDRYYHDMPAEMVVNGETMHIQDERTRLDALSCDLAEDFYNIVLFLHAVPQPKVPLHVEHDGLGFRLVSKQNVAETHRRSMWEYKQAEIEKDTEDCKSKLVYCQVYQSNKKFMDFMRDCAAVTLYVGMKPHVPLRVLSSARYYAMLGRNDAKAREWHRGMLAKMQKGHSTLVPDNALSVVDKSAYASDRHYDGRIAMRALLCRLREVDR